MEITTDALSMLGYFDPRYTCDFDNSSPELRWTDPPAETKEFAIIAEDRDARDGTFTHWVIYAIPAQINHLPAGIPPQETLPNGITQGLNSYRKLGYAGPCPPISDRPHRYFFKLYALNRQLFLPARLTRERFLDHALQYTLGWAEVMGRYQRIARAAG